MMHGRIQGPRKTVLFGIGNKLFRAAVDSETDSNDLMVF